MTALPDPERHAAFYEGVAARRALAFAADTAGTAVLAWAVLPLVWWLAVLVFPATFLAVNLAWRWGGLAVLSATPGMYLLGVELRAADGRPLDARTAGLHTCGFLVASAFVLPQLASAAMMLLTPRGRGLVDAMLGTVAIRRPGRL
jgi:uncharacterized RDD family membrane protein YckC